jgi:hypothetical protein
MAEEFIAVEAKFEMLRPLLPDSELFLKFNRSHDAVQGFQTIRITLLIDCIKDIVKVVLEKGMKAPSLKCLMVILSCDELRNHIKGKYSNIRSIYEAKLDPEIEKIITKHENKQEKKRRLEYEEKYANLNKAWEQLENSELSTKLKSIRNKVAAHLEITKDGHGYRLKDVSDFGLQWTDLENYLNTAKPLIYEATFLTCFTSYDLDGNLENHKKFSTSFWNCLNSS